MSVLSPGRVAFLDLDAAAAELSEELEAAAARVIASGRYVLGPEVERFEESFAAYVGTAHCVGVGSGLDALHLALVAMGVGEGHDVLVPATTYIATWIAVSRTGARPVPVEPDPLTGSMDHRLLEAALTPRTRAVLPVHMHGCPVDMDAIGRFASRHGLLVLEDAAQAHGARWRGRRAGSLGHAGAWSFYPGKNLGALGDGGAVTTDDPALARRLRTLRNYGSSARYVHDERGSNSRLDEIQAALLSVKLPLLDAWNARRARVAAAYLDGLADAAVSTPVVPPGAEHAWHVFAVRSPRRDALAERLAARGIETIAHYPVPPHLQRAYGDMGLREGSLPRAEAAARETLSLPMGPHLRPGEVERVVEAVVGFDADA